MVSYAVPAHATMQPHLHMLHVTLRGVAPGGHYHWLGLDQLRTASEPIEDNHGALYEVWPNSRLPNASFMLAQVLEDCPDMLVVVEVVPSGRAVVLYQVLPNPRTKRCAM